MSRDPIEVPHGGCGEYAAWAIVFDYPFSEWTNGPTCPHAKNGAGGEIIVPRVVMSMTQGGYDYTAVCLDCILETAGKVVR